MGKIGLWLATISWPIVSRVFASIGLGTITFVGASAALNTALSAAKAAFGGISSDILQLLAMAGFFQAMSIMAGGLIAGLGWIVMKRFALQTTG